MTDLGKFTGKLKVDTGFTWLPIWLIGIVFTLGYVQPKFGDGWSGLWELLQFLIIWPLYLGVELR